MFIADTKWISCLQFHFTTMELNKVFRSLWESTEFLPDKTVVVWTTQKDGKIYMDMRTYVVRSFTEQLLKDGVSKDDIWVSLRRACAEPNEYPTGEPYDVIFH